MLITNVLSVLVHILIMVCICLDLVWNLDLFWSKHDLDLGGSANYGGDNLPHGYK